METKFVRVYPETHALIFDIARLLSVELKREVSAAEALKRLLADKKIVEGTK